MKEKGDKTYKLKKNADYLLIINYINHVIKRHYFSLRSTYLKIIGIQTICMLSVYSNFKSECL